MQLHEFVSRPCISRFASFDVWMCVVKAIRPVSALLIAVTLTAMAACRGQSPPPPPPPPQLSNNGIEVFDTNDAYSLIANRVNEVRNGFYVYTNADAHLNHGFPSGFFGALTKIHIDTACLDDPDEASGCSSDLNRLDRLRGNVLMIRFDPLVPGEFAGLNIEEPENWGARNRGVGYDLSDKTTVKFDVRSPDNALVEFGVGGGTTGFRTIPNEWTTVEITLDSLSPQPDLSNLHLLFTVVTNDSNAPDGAIILLDNIRFEPVTPAQGTTLGLPISTETHGVVPRQITDPGRVPVPSDQVVRNLATIYEAAIAAQVLLVRGSDDDIIGARQILDTFGYLMRHDNSGDPLPIAPDGAVGLHSGNFAGMPALHNGQGPGAGRSGEARLAGFSSDLCGPTRFCLVLDGATGGNVAFALLALLDGYEKIGVADYLEDARILARWIHGNLEDKRADSFGGYYLGYPDEGVIPKQLIPAKSVENVADIFTAFSRLAAIEERIQRPAEAALWLERANVAGDFVMRMFDSTTGCFFAGTVPVGTEPSFGIDPTGEVQGDEVINAFLFLDANTFTSMALAESTRYGDQIDWRQPAECVLGRFQRSVSVADRTYQGFNLDETTMVGPNAITWEFTAQVVLLMRFVDRLYDETTYRDEIDFYLEQLGQAQSHDLFTDGLGLVAATLQDIDELPPIEHCVSTPFQCIPQRVGLAATVWGIFAADDINPLTPAISSQD